MREISNNLKDEFTEVIMSLLIETFKIIGYDTDNYDISGKMKDDSKLMIILRKAKNEGYLEGKFNIK